MILQCWFTGFDPHFCLFLKKKQNCFSTGETLVPENSGADLTRCLKKNKRTDDLTSLNIKRTDLENKLYLSSYSCAISCFINSVTCVTDQMVLHL